ncbi:MAG: hypothetical protein RL077_841 [Verrucomicrobiota bacterium]|jgi:hypothetical protein
MHHALTEHPSSIELFTRERRKQRMLQFLERFDRRSWSKNPDVPFLLPFSAPEVKGFAAVRPVRRAARAAN